MKNAMRAVAVVGLSETGKTRLVVRLVEALKGRGLKACVVKRCSHGFSLDTEGKDSSDFARAGADGVAMVSPEGWAAFGPPGHEDVAALAGRLFPGADIVLIEGGKDLKGVPKIEILRAGVSETLVSAPGELLAVVSDGTVPAGVTVPVLDPGETERICDIILSVEEAIMADIKLEVDGREVNLNPFVRTFIERTVLGMVTSLSGIDPEPKRIALVIDRKDAASKPR